MSGLGPVDKRISLGRGLNTHPDPTTLAEGELQTATRVRFHKGVVYKDKGVVQYGADTDATAAAQGIGYHFHPTDPRLLIAADGDIKLDSDGSGTAWTDIKTGLNATADVCFAGQGGATFIGNGIDKVQRFAGGTATTELYDFPRPEDTPIAFAPTPDDILIDSMETATNYTPTGSVTAADDSSVYMWGAKSMLLTFAGAGTGERVDRDLGAGNTIDLSDSDYVSVWVMSSVIGNFFVLKMSEDGSTYYTKWVDIPADKLNRWVQVIWDIRYIPASSRNAMRYLRFGIPGTQACSIRVDHLAHCGPLAGEYLYGISFVDADTGESGPIGCFRRAATEEPDDYSQTTPRRAMVIPSGTAYLPTGADRIRLYRTMAGASGTFYKIADITPSAAAWTYTDTTPDNELAEADAVVLWPGSCPRTQWLVPHADRMLHVGGMVVASRNDAYYSESDPNNRSTGVMNPSPYPPLPVYGHEFYVSFGGTGTLSFSLQRTTKGGSSWTTVATSSANQTWAATTFYRLAFTPSSYGDIMFDPARYDWRILCTARPSGLTLANAWATGLTGPLFYRLLCHSHNLVFMSNLGEPDRIPPMDVDSEDVNELTGGYFVVGDADGQKITGWAKHGSDLLFFKERLTYLMTGRSMDDVEVALVHPSLGCKAWRTSIDCDGSAVWMAADRQIYIWESETAPQMLSKPIEEFFDGLTDAQCVGACAVYSERRYYVFLPAAPVGSRCRYYDFDERAWAAGNDSKVYAAMAHGDDPSVAQPYLLRLGTTYAEVIKLNNTESEEAGDVTWLARSRAEEFADIIPDRATVKRLRAYRLWVKGTAADTLTTKWYVDRGTTATRTYTDTIPSGSGFRSITRCVDNDIMGENLAVEVGGAHDTETAIAPVDLWVHEVR